MISEALKELRKGVLLGIPPIGASLTEQITHLSMPETLRLVTVLYTLVLIFKQLPKMYGCAACFCRNRTCTRTCKD